VNGYFGSKQGQNARENDADGRCSLRHAGDLFRAKSDQLRPGDGGENAARHEVASLSGSSGVYQQLFESLYLWDEQQKLLPWLQEALF